jgi:hypothetical protein
MDWMKEIVAVGVGLVDPALEAWDEKNSRTGMMRTYADYVRFGGVALGLASQVWFKRYEKYGEALALSFTPLLVKSLAGPSIKSAVTGGSTMFVPRGRTIPANAAGVTFVPPGTPGGYRAL